MKRQKVMVPYLRAHAAYHAAGAQEIPWTIAMDIHLQLGAVLSTPDVFVMARPVCPHWPEEMQTDLSEILPDSATWHIFAAAGDLSKLFIMARIHRVQSVTYQRRGAPRIHRLPLPWLKAGAPDYGSILAG